jgi:hypothetical protein
MKDVHLDSYWVEILLFLSDLADGLRLEKVEIDWV